MPVDISDILHVLAHELRTPSGIAQGYVRMLLEDRLTVDADRRRALEQIQQALGRVSELTRESSRLAEWYKRNGGTDVAISVADLVTRAVQNVPSGTPPTIRVDDAAAKAMLASPHRDELVTAVSAVVNASIRELRHTLCVVESRIVAAEAVLLIGAAEQIESLASGPNGADASPPTFERGGVGLSLIQAAEVLEAHRATLWTVGRSRSSMGIYLPLTERAHP